jgi:hypothetical protein
VVECLPSKFKASSSTIPCTTGKKKKGGKKEIKDTNGEIITGKNSGKNAYFSNELDKF